MAHIEVALRQKYVTPAMAKPVLERAEDVGKMLHGLLRSLRRRLKEERRRARAR